MLHCMPTQGNAIPSRSILHSFCSLLESSSNFASILRLVFLFSSSSPSWELWQDPMVAQACCRESNSGKHQRTLTGQGTGLPSNAAGPPTPQQNVWIAQILLKQLCWDKQKVCRTIKIRVTEIPGIKGSSSGKRQLGPSSTTVRPGHILAGPRCKARDL